MKPPRESLLDIDDRTFATPHYVAPGRLAVTGRGIELDGHLVPVLHQWQRREMLNDYMWEHMRLPPAQRLFGSRADGGNVAGMAAADRSEAIVCYADRQRAGLLDGFARNIRETGFDGAIAVIGVDFHADDVAAASRHDCRLVRVDARYAAAPPSNAAHLYFHDVLPHIEAEDLLLVDDTNAIFVGDPFRSKTSGVCFFAEGIRLVRECPANTHWLSQFDGPCSQALDRPIVSSAVIAGRAPALRGLYARLFKELGGKENLLMTPKMVQGAFNKLAHAAHGEWPVTIRPNGSVGYFSLWPHAMAIETDPVVRVGGAAPAVIFPAG